MSRLPVILPKPKGSALGPKALRASLALSGKRKREAEMVSPCARKKGKQKRGEIHERRREETKDADRERSKKDARDRRRPAKTRDEKITHVKRVKRNLHATI